MQHSEAVQDRHGRRVHRVERDPRPQPEEHDHEDEDDEGRPLRSASVGQAVEVRIGRRRAPEDDLGHPDHVDRGEEGADHRWEEPPGIPSLPGAEERQELGDEARRRGQPE